MTYYRMALQERQSSTWTWKSTVLTSLDAVLHLLRIYSAIPQEHIRVFTAASKADMDEMLSRENNGLASGSVTAAQFLKALPSSNLSLYKITARLIYFGLSPSTYELNKEVEGENHLLSDDHWGRIGVNPQV